MNDSQDKYMKKKGLALVRLARDFMNYSVGNRIPTIAEYAERFSSARGTVQSAIKILQDDGCVEIVKRGHQGSYITMIDYEHLWEFTDWGILTGAMPLPYSRRLEGFATAIYESMQKKIIPFNFGYMQGADNRAAALLNHKYDFAIMSLKAATSWLEKSDELVEVLRFNPCSYISSHVVLMREQAGELTDGMSVGIDESSPDHIFVTQQYCKGRNVKFKPQRYAEIPASIANGYIDAALYNRDVILEMLAGKNESWRRSDVRYLDGLKYLEIDPSYTGEDGNIATLLIHKSDYGLMNLLRRILDPDTVEQIQNSVIVGKTIPHY